MGDFFKSRGFKIAVFVIVLLLAIVLIIEGTLLDNKGFFNKHKDLASQLDEESTKEDDGNNIILMPNDEIYSFSFTDADGVNLHFERTDDGWVYVDNPKISIDSDRVNCVLNYLGDVKCIDVIRDADPEKYGLVKESPVAVITDSSDSSIYISFGDFNEDKGQFYYAINYDYSTVYVNSGKLNKIMHYRIEDLIKN